MSRREDDGVGLALALSPADAQRLAAAFGIGADNVAQLTAIAQAALDEYVDYFGGIRVPTSIRDAREQRLAALLRRGVPGAATESRIASLFALTPGQARTLLAGTRARYRTALVGALAAAVGDSLRGPGRSGTLAEDRVWFRAPASLVAVMRDLVADASEAYAPIGASTRASQTYVTDAATLRYVCSELGIDENEVEALRE